MQLFSNFLGVKQKASLFANAFVILLSDFSRRLSVYKEVKYESFFIIEDTVFYYPQMMDTVLQDKRFEWVGMAVNYATKSMDRYFLRHVFDIGIISGLKLFIQKYKAIILDKFGTGKPRTLKAVAQNHSLPCITVENVNDEAFIQYLHKLNIDVIVSSNPQIFKERLLSLPRIACINRHTSLLPAHGGILPVFQGIADGDQYTGVTIHMMEKGIDLGAIIVQRAIEIPQNPVQNDLYKIGFEVSAVLILEALDILANNKPFRYLEEPARKQSYSSFPNKDDWKRFKAHNGRFA